MKIYSALFACLLPLAITSGCDQSTQAVETTESPVERMKREVASGEAAVVDVRSQDEWDAGHLKAAQFVPITSLEDGVDPEDVEGLSRERPVYTYCKAGVRASRAAEILQKAGFDARPLEEGFEELKAAGLPTE